MKENGRRGSIRKEEDGWRERESWEGQVMKDLVMGFSDSAPTVPPAV